MPKKKNTASSLNKEKFLIIGAGNMGIAVIKSLFNHRISSKKIVVIEKNQSSELKKLKKSNNFEIKNSIGKINNLYQPTITLIAVKPNQLKTLNGLDKYNKLGNSIVVSVVAGKKIKDLNKVFKKTSGIVRAMTNTPVSVNMGTTVVCFERKIKTKQKKPIFDFMSLLGQVSETKKRRFN
jgi:pyrroline-5-carboxylate reductase